MDDSPLWLAFTIGVLAVQITLLIVLPGLAGSYGRSPYRWLLLGCLVTSPLASLVLRWLGTVDSKR
jgi:hypothetical protein